MRNPAFRAWDTKLKKYACVGFHVIGEVTAMGGIECYIRENIEEEKKLGIPCGSLLERYNDFILEQWTGLLDKNGKEIYEGDIVTWGPDIGNWPVVWGTLKIEGNYEDVVGTGWITGEDYNDVFIDSRCEVLGNIHENPEILTK
ncbi:YopX protein [uncultured archaeon]|nr:YopX protein [uncultured archaeon]